MWKVNIASAAVLAQVIGSWAATVTYNWEVTWVTASPDGFARPVVGINGQWPCPPISANAGDTILINLENSLGNQTTGLHFHGINQYNTNFMDGASMANGCPVAPGTSITYQFTVDAPGTYWYHSHNMAQYPDGLRGPLIVHDPNDPYADSYDSEVILTVSDWYHDQTTTLIQTMLVPGNDQWRPPIPDSMILNEGQDADIQLDIGKTTRVRIISFAALTGFMFNFNAHPMEVIMTDGSYVEQQKTSQIRLAPAQRYDVLLTGAKQDRGTNFPYLVSMDLNRDYTVTATWNTNMTGYLVTDDSLSTTTYDIVHDWEPYEEAKFVPLDYQSAYGPVTKTWKLDFVLCKDINGIPRMCFNNQTYVSQKTPTLYSAATLGSKNTDPNVYGAVIPFIVEYGDVVDLIVNNLDPAIHPFHLHGHQFQIIERPPSGTGSYTGKRAQNTVPPRRDVVAINGASYAVLRFVANNPGVFLFHCHIEWHVTMGLTATLIEAPEYLSGLTIPQDMVQSCKAQGIPISGNAGGNLKNPNDYSNYNTIPPTSYYGAEYPLPSTASPGRIRRQPSNGRTSPEPRFETVLSQSIEERPTW